MAAITYAELSALKRQQNNGNGNGNGHGPSPAAENKTTGTRIPGVMSDTVVRLFGRGEAFDSEGFIGFFTDTPMYEFGNADPCLNKAAIKASVDNFFGSVAALYHDIRNLWEVGDAMFVEMDVTYWRKDGSVITLPCSDIFRFEG